MRCLKWNQLQPTKYIHVLIVAIRRAKKKKEQRDRETNFS